MDESGFVDPLAPKKRPRVTGARVPPAERKRIWKLYLDGHNYAAISRLTGYDRRQVSAICKGLQSSEGKQWAAARELEDQPDPRQFRELPPEARRALEDFGYFRGRYFGRLATPWQEEAAYRVLELLETPEKEHAVINAPPSCLAGDTLITINPQGNSRRIPIRELVEKFNGGNLGRKGEKCWDPAIPTRVQRAMTGIHAGFHLWLVPVVRAVAAGVKVTYTLTTVTGRSIRATAEHRFALDGGRMVELQDLRVGDQVLVDGGKGGWPGGARREYREIQGLVNHPHRGAWPYRQRVHRLVVEADMNGLPLDWYVALLRDKYCGVSSLKFSTRRRRFTTATATLSTTPSRTCR